MNGICVCVTQMMCNKHQLAVWFLCYGNTPSRIKQFLHNAVTPIENLIMDSPISLKNHIICLRWSACALLISFMVVKVFIF